MGNTLAVMMKTDKIPALIVLMFGWKKPTTSKYIKLGDDDNHLEKYSRAREHRGKRARWYENDGVLEMSHVVL